MARVACSQGVKPKLADLSCECPIAERSLSIADQTDRYQRDILPIPDRTYVGLTTYDAKDPAAKFPPITPLRPLPGARNVKEREPVNQAYMHSWTMAHFGQLLKEFQMSVRHEPLIRAGAPLAHVPKRSAD
jgi:hypothetical protein